MFYSSKLSKFENIKHCFFSRENGSSKGIYKSLNCGLGSNDNKENVLKNLELVSNKIFCKKENLITLNQKHTNKVIHFNNNALPVIAESNLECSRFYFLDGKEDEAQWRKNCLTIQNY